MQVDVNKCIILVLKVEEVLLGEGWRCWTFKEMAENLKQLCQGWDREITGKKEKVCL